jgi:hypothetical protein
MITHAVEQTYKHWLEQLRHLIREPDLVNSPALCRIPESTPDTATHRGKFRVLKISRHAFVYLMPVLELLHDA